MFQSENPFEDRYIEAPDPAHAPPSTGWRRFDTHFQLLAYYDPDRAVSRTLYFGVIVLMFTLVVWS